MERLLTLLMERDVICTTILARMLPLPRPIGALVCTFLAGDVGCQALALAEPTKEQYELETHPGDYIRNDLHGSKLKIRSRLRFEGDNIYTELTITTTSRDGSTECLRDRQLSFVATKEGDIRNS